MRANHNHTKIKIGKRFSIQGYIGSGTFGDVYLANDTWTGGQVALKIEKSSSRSSEIKDESKIYRSLRNRLGVPSLIASETKDPFKYLAMELLGPTLGELLTICGRTFSLQTTVLLFIQLIDRLEMLHETQMLHRDIQPGNFTMGMKESSGTVHVIDFGLSKSYADEAQEDGHIKFSTEKSIIGTAMFASVNAHAANELSRRDDLEALGYMMIFFLCGTLPWGDIERPTSQETFDEIGKVKKRINMVKLCKNCPDEFLYYMTEVKGLKFKQKPDYGFLRGIMQDLASWEGLALDINCFDWCYVFETNHEALAQSFDFPSRRDNKTYARMEKRLNSGNLRVIRNTSPVKDVGERHSMKRSHEDSQNLLDDRQWAQERLKIEWALKLQVAEFEFTSYQHVINALNTA